MSLEKKKCIIQNKKKVGANVLNGTDKVMQYYNEIQGVAAVILGLLLQYFLGDGRGAKIALIITLSTLFVALFIAPAIIEALNINPASKLSNAIYALSALMSVEMLAIFIKVLPEAIRIRTEKYLGVKDVDE